MYINTISIAFNQNDTILSSPNIITIDNDILHLYIYLTNYNCNNKHNHQESYQSKDICILPLTVSSLPDNGCPSSC